MFSDNFTGRRRTTRNRTVVVDPRDLQGAPSVNPAATPTTYNQSDVVPIMFGSQSRPGRSIGERSFAFTDLMSAFQTIDKRSSDDPHVVWNALKRFKTNEETAVESSLVSVKMRVKTDIFPKIMNNPFIRNDLEIPTEIIEDETRVSKLRKKPHGAHN